MSRASTITFNLLKLSLLLIAANAYADSGACSTASLTNPYSIDGGISGTGAPAKGGVSGTGDKVAAGGVSGTGDKVAKGGVSGTGAPEAGGVAGTGALVAKGGGIGGTGDSVFEYALLPIDAEGDIGIMGVVTGFASICVNGEEVHYEDATPIYDNGKVAKLADLAVGKTVMLKVSKVDGSLHAKAIALFDAVTGPVKGVDVTRQQINVMGQNVHVSQSIARQLAGENAGITVRVSGYRLDNGDVVASRVDLAGRESNANTLGLVTSVARDGFTVNGTKVTVADKQALNKIKVGSEVQVSGSWSGEMLKASHIETQPINNVVSRVDSAILEGYVRKDGRNHLSLSGTEVTSVQDDSFGKLLDSFKDKLVKVELRRNNSGKWVTEKVSERKGKRLDNDTQSNDNNNRGSGSSGKDESTSNSPASSDSSGHGSSNSGSSESSGHGSSGSSSGPSGGHGGSGGGSSSSSSHGGASGGSSGSGRSSGGGSSGGSSGSSGRNSSDSSGSSGGSGKYK